MKSEFLGLLSRLAKYEVDFVIVGGFAGVVYGCIYVTQDIDICCDFSSANLMRLQEALCGLHPVHRMTPGRQELKLTEENCSQYKNLYLDTDLGQLDCLGSINGFDNYEMVRQASKVINVEGVKMCILSLDGLIQSKKAMNRPRDKEALLQLEAIRKFKKGQK